VAGQVLSHLQFAPIFQIRSDPGAPKGMAADAARVEAGLLGPGFDHAQDRGPAHRAPRERLRPCYGTEERKVFRLSAPVFAGFAIARAACGFQIDVQVVFGLVVERDVSLLAAFLPEAHFPAAPGLLVILPSHPYNRGHACERVCKDADDGLVTLILDGGGREPLDELRCFFGSQDGRRALALDVLRSLDRLGGIDVQDAPTLEPVEELPEGREVLLDCRRRSIVLLDVGGGNHRSDPLQGESLPLGPSQKLPDGPPVGLASIFISDLGSEEFEEAFLGLRIRLVDERREARLEDGGEPTGTVFGDFPGGFVADLRLESVGHGRRDYLGSRAVKYTVTFTGQAWSSAVPRLPRRWRRRAPC